MKKTIAIAAFILLAALFAGRVQAAALTAGSVIKAAGKSAVYYYAEDGKKHLYPDMATLLSWYPDKKFNIITISPKALSLIPAGEISKVKPGTLVKLKRLATIYKSLKYGQLCYATSASFADNNFGQGWRQKISNIFSGLANYKIIGPCPEETGLASACDVADPSQTDVTVGGLRLYTYIKYAGPFTEDQKAELESSLNGISNISNFRAWTFSNQDPNSAGDTNGGYIKIAVAMRLNFSNAADLEAARLKLISASNTTAMPTIAPEMPALQYQSCQVAGHDGQCLIVDPSVIADKLKQICSTTPAESTNTLQQFGYNLLCSGMMFPAEMAFVYVDGLDLSVVMRINMLKSAGNIFVSSSSQSQMPATYPDGFIMLLGQQDSMLSPYIDYLNQCKSMPPTANDTCAGGQFCQSGACGPLPDGPSSCENVSRVCYQYCTQDSDCSGGRTCQLSDCITGDAIERIKVCK